MALEGSRIPAGFGSHSQTTVDYAWVLEEDVDWMLGPHARAVGEEVRVALQTHDTYRGLAGLLRRLGATSARVRRGDE